MNIWIVENGKPILYERLGQCSQCGQCCQGKVAPFRWKVITTAGEDTEPSGDWSEYEGWSVFKELGLWWYYKTSLDKKERQICAGLTDDMKCSVWHDSEEFPHICKHWPLHPRNLEEFPECTFSFRRWKE